MCRHRFILLYVLLLMFLFDSPAVADMPDIELGLEWLAKHQHPDGHWASRDYHRGEATTPYALVRYKGTTDGRGERGYDVAVTGMAMLAFLGYGETHRSGNYTEYRPVMTKATQWLLSQQVKSDGADNGRIGPRDDRRGFFNHVLATMALAELAILSEDRSLLSEPVRAATEHLLRGQLSDGGWAHAKRDRKSDVSATTWSVLALKTARACARHRLLPGLNRESFAGPLEQARGWLAEEGDGKRRYSAGKGPFPTRGARKARVDYDPRVPTVDAAAVLARFFSGDSRKHESLKRSIKLLSENPPKWQQTSGDTKSTIDFCYWYFGTYAMFQHGGKPWRDWVEPLQVALADSQIIDGEEAGSWDPVGRWGPVGGRVYATAIGCMTSEVFHRFVRAGKGSVSIPPTKRERRKREPIDRARAWLLAHQHPDGYWSSQDYYRKDTSKPYALVKYSGFTDGRGMPGFDIGVTGLAMRALTGLGSDADPKIQRALKKAEKWLLEQQVDAPGKPEHGRIGRSKDERWIYNHALATRALTARFAGDLDNDKLRFATTRALRLLLRAQNPDAGWRYGIRPGSSDVSVTAWAIDTLQWTPYFAYGKAIDLSRQELEKSVGTARRWLETLVSDGGESRYGDGDLTVTQPSRNPANANFAKLPHLIATSIAARKPDLQDDRPGRRFSKPKKTRPGMPALEAARPQWQVHGDKKPCTVDLCYWFFGTEASYLLHEEWESWAAAANEALKTSQISDGPETGSWDPIGRWGSVGGRVYSTALSCMILIRCHRR
ncbi:MAG: prenyltransferase/squalene oxidase repeat-containing protein [Planctomycetota bacterium]